MAQKRVLITGATSGIGLAGVEALGKLGWRVLLHARNDDRGRTALDQLRLRVPSGTFEVVTGDLSSVRSVEALARDVARRAPVLDALWNNAGGLGLEFKRKVSPDGIELQRAVNYLAPFVLTQRLLPQLQAATAGRIVTTSSSSHRSAPAGPTDWFADDEKRYRHMVTYGIAKLSTILFTQELARRVAETSVAVHAFDPGYVRTGFGNGGDSKKWTPFKLVGFLFVPPARGADTGVFLVDSDEPARTSGLYWKNRRPIALSRAATPQAAAALWTQTEALVERILAD